MFLKSTFYVCMRQDGELTRSEKRPGGRHRKRSVADRIPSDIGYSNMCWLRVVLRDTSCIPKT